MDENFNKLCIGTVILLLIIIIITFNEDRVQEFVNKDHVQEFVNKEEEEEELEEQENFEENINYVSKRIIHAYEVSNFL